MGNLIPGDPPRLPGVRLMVFVGLCSVLSVIAAIGASLLQLQHDQAVRRQSDDALAMTHLAFDAESLASRLRAVQELGEQAGVRAPMAAAQLREVLRAVDIDNGEWDRRVSDTLARELPPDAQAQLSKLRAALVSLRSAVSLPGDGPASLLGSTVAPVMAPAGATAATPPPEGTPGVAAAAPPATAPAGTPPPVPAPPRPEAAAGAGPAIVATPERAYLAAVEAAQGTLLAAVRAGTDPPVLRNYTLGELYAATVIGASGLALLLALLLGLLIRRGRRESRVAIGVMGQLLRTDPLTGITNRRGLDENLPVEMARAKRNGRILTVAMLDLDFFKRYNSRRGHAGGDALLRSAAQSWRKQLRPTDTLVRYGGEEFTLVLPSCDAEQACQLIDRLRPQLPDGQTFSAGVATWDTLESGEALLRRADQALLLAKKQGRNRTIVAGREDQISLALTG